MPTLAALITVYHGTDAGELAVALQSLAVQTRPADDILIVLDGPVDASVEGVVEGFADKQQRARLLRLERNLGSGPASQAGLEAIDAEYVARLDSDDAAKPERFAAQLAYLQAHPEVAALGTAVEEFEGALTGGGKIRALPADPNEYVKLNSPINNPSVMFRRDAVVAVGGYKDVPFMEDYDLWARLVAGGYCLANLPEALTYFRVGEGQLARRSDPRTRRAERQMQRNLVEYGLISRPRAVANWLVRNLYRALPVGVTQRVYSLLFHRAE